MSANLVNLAAVNALQINMNRMNEINGQSAEPATPNLAEQRLAVASPGFPGVQAASASG